MHGKMIDLVSRVVCLFVLSSRLQEHRRQLHLAAASMGVQGLTTYVKQVQRVVAEEVNLRVPETSSSAPSSPHHLIIDGWAWMYRAYYDQVIDVVRGGDYLGYMLYVRQVLSAFRASGLEPIFMFDGPYLPQKIPTVLSRMGDLAASNSVFMRSSYRSKASSQSAMSLPPLLYDATLEALRFSKVQVVISESEADGAVAEMAERLGGWAVSNDSDFFILCSRGTKCRGYVPIDSIHYLVKLPMSKAQADAAAAARTDDDGFAPVTKRGKAQVYRPKAVVKRESVTYQPPVTPEDGDLLGVQFMAYSSIKLAGVLGISPAMLPLLAALVGNDYTTSTQRRILSPALPSGPARVELIAQYIKDEGLRMASPGGRTNNLRSGTATPSAGRAGIGRTALAKSAVRSASIGGPASTSTSATATPTGTAMHPKLDEALAALALNDPVRFMVHNVIERILANSATKPDQHIGPADKDELVDSIIESVYTYSLLTHASSLHLASPAAAFFKTPASHSNVTNYQKAYELGYFERTNVEALTLKMALTRVVPEDPDQKSIQVTHARDLRRWIFTTLFSSWGMNWARDTLEEPAVDVEDDDQESSNGARTRAIPIVAGPGANRVDWAKEGDPDEMIPVQTPPSSFGSSLNISDDDDDDDDDDEIKSRPGSAVGLLDDEINVTVKPPPAVTEYARKGERYAADLCPLWSLETLVQSHRDELGIEPPQSLGRFLATAH